MVIEIRKSSNTDQLIPHKLMLISIITITNHYLNKIKISLLEIIRIYFLNLN